VLELKRQRHNRQRGGSQRISSRYIVRKLLEIQKPLRNKKANQLRKLRNHATESRALLKKSKKTKKRQREKLEGASHVLGKLRGLWYTSAKMKLPNRKKRKRKRVQVKPLIRERLKGRARAEVEDVMR